MGADNTDLDHIPGDYGIPYFGCSLSLIFRFYEFTKGNYEKYGEVSRMKLLHQRGIMLQGAENCRETLIDKNRNFSTEAGYASTLRHFFEGGILLRDFEDHRIQRRILQTAFKIPAMKGYIEQMNPIIEKDINSFGTVNNFSIGPHIKQTLLDIACKSFIGVENATDGKKFNQAFLDISGGLIALLKKEVPFTKFYYAQRGRRRLHDYIMKLIPKRRVGNDTDILSYMCRERMEDGSYFADEDIISHLGLLLYAGHDSTTSVLNHIVMYTAMNPIWQDKLREEAISLGKNNLEWKDLDKLELMSRVIHEVLRLHPPAPMLARRTLRDCEIGGYFIPARTMVYLPLVYNQRDPRYWTNPEEFDPDRFSQARQEQNNVPASYSPFGGGAHKCIGLHFSHMLIKTFMFKFLMTYKYQTPPNFKPRLLWLPLPKPAKLPLSLERI